MAESGQFQSFSRGDVVARRFEVQELLGEGMLGATYLAKNLQSGKYVALKVLRPELVANPRERERLEQVFQSVKELRHDGLVRFGELIEHQGLTCYTQEYFQSQSLRQLLDEYQANQQSFTLNEACAIVIKVLEALEFLHDNGIYHRNLKPENVLIHTKKIGPGTGKLVRTVKVSGAGMSELLSSTILAESFLTKDDMPYLAPEHAGFRLAGAPASDVYSVGVILYELLVGQTPRGTYLSPTQLRGDLPDHIDDIVEIALAANAEDRYPSAHDMLTDIQRSFSGEMIETRGRTSFRNILIGLGLGLAVLAIAGAYVGLRDTPDPTADARAKDDRLRAELSAATKPPTEAELNAMVEKHREMLYIPPGPFLMGRLNHEDLKTASQSEPLTKQVELGGFYIDRFEFPNRVVDSKGSPVRPVAKVTWKEASDACGEYGKRLCSEEEWEKACKGPANLIYSYGDEYSEEACGSGIDQSYTLGERENCISGYGVLDLSGGLREWTATVAGSKGNRRVVKGGLRANNQRGSRCAFAVDESADYADATLSFRCCLDVDAGASAPAPTEPPAE